MNNKNTAAALLTLLLMSLVHPVGAGMHVVPSELADAEGALDNWLPFSSATPNGSRYQQVFGASDFSSLSGPQWITEIAFRPDANYSFPASEIIPDVRISLSTTSKGVDALSMVFADNLGSDETVVISGPMQIVTNPTGPAGGPMDFSTIIKLTTPFYYDPALGNLLLDVTVPRHNSVGALDAVWSEEDAVSSVFTNSSSPDALTADSANSIGLVTRFTAVAEIPMLDQPPIADAGEDKVLIEPGSTVELNGLDSFDPEGDALEFLWYLDRPIGSGAWYDDFTSPTPRFVPDRYGDYVATLTVTDSEGHMGRDEVIISFRNLAPTADAGPNQAVLVGDTVELDGRASSDANGDALRYAWTIDSKPIGSLANIAAPNSELTNFVPDIAGTYNVQLVVNDLLLTSDPDYAEIVVISVEDAIFGALMDAIDVINALDITAFKSRNMRKPLTGELNEVLRKITQGQSHAALVELEHTILTRTDGCSVSGIPDQTDWLMDCDAQSQVHPVIAKSIALLRRLIYG